MVTGKAYLVSDCDFEGVGLCQCQRGHVFDKKFRVTWSPSFPPQSDMLLQLDKCTDSKKECAEFRKLTLENLKQEYAARILDVDYYGVGGNGGNINEHQCPICMLTEVSKDDLLKYMFKVMQTTREDVLTVIRKQFGDYKSFKAYLSSKSPRS